MTIERIQRRKNPALVPTPVPGEPGLFQSDATWGSIEPMRVAAGVQTIGEVELLAHMEEGLAVIDSRTTGFFVRSTLPAAVSIPYPEAVARIRELDRKHPSVLFCNGPQCGQSPTAIRALLAAGFPPDLILYYRGGLHDWITLGLPIVEP